MIRALCCQSLNYRRKSKLVFIIVADTLRRKHALLTSIHFKVVAIEVVKELYDNDRG